MRRNYVYDPQFSSQENFLRDLFECAYYSVGGSTCRINIPTDTVTAIFRVKKWKILLEPIMKEQAEQERKAQQSIDKFYENLRRNENSTDYEIPVTL